MEKTINESWLLGGGALGDAVREKDWSKTPLGPLHSWSQSLRTAINTCLNCSFPIVTWWGPDLILIYNDAYIPMLGAKHPHSLGQKGRECWSEVWHVIGPMLDQVLAVGQASTADDLQLLIERGGYLEEGYFSFSYSPIYCENGGICGIFCPVLETTEKVVGARRRETLRELAALSSAGTLNGALQEAADVLARNGYDAPFALLYRMSEDGRTAHLASTAGIAAGQAASPMEIPINVGGAWPLHLARQRACFVEGLARQGLPVGRWLQAPDQVYLAPLILPGAKSASGILVVGLNPHKRIDQSYQSFLDLVASHISAKVADTVAYEAERKRAEALAEIDRAKTTFFSNVSHELRTPLTLVLGPLEKTLARVDGESHEELTLAHRSSLRLLRLVNTLLDFTSVEAGRIQANYEPIDISAFTADLASNFRSACDLAGLKLVLNCPPLPEALYIDREMWEKIVLNLLSNAFKFTFAGEIEVSCRADGAFAEIAVRDTGTGISEQELPRIFERFHRIENAKSRTHEGTGIGLALVKELVKLHCGTIEASSVEGEGSVFTIRLPFGASHLPKDRIGAAPAKISTATRAEAFVQEALRWLPEERIAPLREPGELAAAPGDGGKDRPRLLVADDNADMRAYLRSILDALYEVETVTDGLAALEAIRSRRPALAIFDVMMPRMDGFAALSALRKDASLKHLPIILLSARAGEEAETEGLAAGADDYIVKPFNARELLARVRAKLAMANLRNEAADAVRASEKQLQAAVDLVRLGLYSWNPQTNELRWDDTLRAMWGVSAGAPIDYDTWLACIHPDDIPRVEEAKQHCLDPERDGVYNIEYRVIGKNDGVERWIATRGRTNFENGVPASFYGAARDVTDRKRIENTLEARVQARTRELEKANRELQAQIEHRKIAEAEVHQLQRLVAIGQLTSGLAHDFNNLLSVILINARLLAADVRDPFDQEGVELIRAAADRGASLTAQLLAFSRKQKLEPQAVNLNRMIAGMKDLLSASLSASVQLQTALADDLCSALADPIQLELMILNLVLNARDAMPSGGVLTLETFNIVIDTEPSYPEELAPGQYVGLAVRDTGTGIADDVLPHVFEPFFSTKEAGKGSGLGLAQVLGFTKQSNGGVSIESRLGQGTTVKIALPRAEAVPHKYEGASSEANRGSVANDKKKILVVDDDEAVLTSTLRLLGSLGYSAIPAKSGSEALQRIVKEPEIDLVLADIAMPGMTGVELATTIKSKHPHLPVILVTGYGDHDVFHDNPRARILKKPIEAKELIDKIAEA
ncbi:MAG: response regulator [Hyphomicrobiales bacterium]|nr:response regulator [Hyphomicrobiales bacterium]